MKQKNKKIFVTGGGGFIGRAVVKRLLENGSSVVAFDLSEQLLLHRDTLNEYRSIGSLELVDGTILDKRRLQGTISGCDAVIHLAAMLGVRRTEENRLGCIEINITGSDCVLEACVAHDISRVLLASSSEVYGEPITNPIKEDDITQGKTVYAVTKLASEELIKGYHQLFPKMKYTILRFFNTYGEGQVAQFVLSKFVHAVLSGKNPVVYGDGSQLRGYCHVDDISRGIVDLLWNEISYNKTYNLGNSKETYTLQQIAQMTIDTLQPDKGLQVEILGGFDGTDRVAHREIYNRYCDTTRAYEDFGFEAKITIEEGIKRMAEQEIFHHNWPNA
jgi:UDP-glucose 4-epimerase